jgi:dTDP-D-glucose 4,6-dehydratase
VSRIRNLGWAPETELRSGITSTYQWYENQIDNSNKP